MLLPLNTSFNFDGKYSPKSEFLSLVSNDESHAKLFTWNFHMQRQGQLLIKFFFDRGFFITMAKPFWQIVLGTRLN